MNKRIISVLAGSVLLLFSASFAGSIEPYQAEQVGVYKARDIEPYQAKTIKPRESRPVKPYRGREVKPVRGSGQMRLFTEEDRRRMHENDRAAGRTHDSMSRKSSSRSSAGEDSIMFKDPYNTGGWNYNTNQSASPIWNPNSQ